MPTYEEILEQSKPAPLPVKIPKRPLTQEEVERRAREAAFRGWKHAKGVSEVPQTPTIEEALRRKSQAAYAQEELEKAQNEGPTTADDDAMGGASVPDSVEDALSKKSRDAYCK